MKYNVAKVPTIRLDAHGHARSCLLFMFTCQNINFHLSLLAVSLRSTPQACFERAFEDFYV